MAKIFSYRQVAREVVIGGWGKEAVSLHACIQSMSPEQINSGLLIMLMDCLDNQTGAINRLTDELRKERLQRAREQRKRRELRKAKTQA